MTAKIWAWCKGDMGKRTEAKAGRERAEVGIDALRGESYLYDSVEVEAVFGPSEAWMLHIKARVVGEKMRVLYTGPLADLLQPGARLVLEGEEDRVDRVLGEFELTLA